MSGDRTVLVIGGGGREHALAWAVSRSDTVGRVLVAPGNAGTALDDGIENVAVDADDIESLVALAQRESVDLTIVGPEAPLVNGVVDRFEAAGLRCFGPRASAARLEGSKSYTKAFLERHNIPTAAYQSFTDFESARRYIESRGAPIVVKADGLAAGKGVVVATRVEEAVDAARSMLVDAEFADAGAEIVVEDCLVGEEASFICVVDGTSVMPLATSQDHKARDNGDTGPNTGGMGAYSPAPVVTATVYDRIMRDVVLPTVRGLSRDGEHYTGFLYAGLMIDSDGQPRVLEYNCRFGDPETQPILFRLRSDLVALLDAALDHELDSADIQWDPRASLGVVIAAGGYPASYAKGHRISGLDRVDDAVKVFHAGTALDGGDVVTSGGRVLCVTALGETVGDAQRAAYNAAQGIGWEGSFYRTDIGHRAVSREAGS